MAEAKSYSEGDLFLVFCAGFDASGEGHNGEYVCPPWDGGRIGRALRWQFARYLAGEDHDYLALPADLPDDGEV